MKPLRIPPPGKPPEIELLSDKQRVICWLAAFGLTADDIAERLGISRRLVELRRNEAAKVLRVPTGELTVYCGRNWQWLQRDEYVQQFT